MSKIKVEFHRHENFVYGRVLEMPEDLRGKDIINNGTYGIFSDEKPELDGKCLYLKGEYKYCDNEWFACTYCDNDTAEKAIQSFQSLLEKWNEEHKEILTEEEKTYLSAVIKPWKNRIKCIEKHMWNKKEYIFIVYDDKEDMYLPEFAPNSMYKGMKIGKSYTLKELGLEWNKLNACEMCEKRSIGMGKILSLKTGWICGINHEHETLAVDHNGDTENVKINYCPWCGRKLDGETN